MAMAARSIARCTTHLLCPRIRLVQVGRRALAVSASAGTEGGKPVHIVGISGSLRKHSRNTGLLRAAAKRCPPGVTFELLDISQLPLYNDDMWQGLDAKNDDSALPAQLRQFRAKVAAADAVMFASPEYNHSVSGPLKNAIDWGSKGPSVFARKLVTTVAAAGGSLGARSATALESIMAGMGALFLPAPPYKFVLTSAYSAAFDQEGNVVDKVLEDKLALEVARLVEWSAKYKQIM